ncbi:MAG: hypothetical protein HYV15_03000 [Elusimicrobia bacterium]|nr:hypothetical protein [Elusimicrobiota bacterium]
MRLPLLLSAFLLAVPCRAEKSGLFDGSEGKKVDLRPRPRTATSTRP